MSEILEAEPFLKGTYKSMGDAHRDSFNPEYWRHGITISRGNGWNISEQVARERLVFIGQKLRRLMFGNQYRKKSSIEFYVYKHGAENSIRSIDLDNPLRLGNLTIRPVVISSNAHQGMKMFVKTKWCAICDERASRQHR
jgi:hypothetical protein